MQLFFAAPERKKMQKTNIIILVLILVFVVWGNFRATVPAIAAESVGLDPKEFFSTHLSMQANQFALLQIYLSVLTIVLTVLGIVLAVAAIWGYKEIKDIAIKIAEKKIQEIVPSIVKSEIRQLGEEERDRTIFGTNMEKSDNITDKVFHNGIEMIDKEGG
jgi:hypothetical protein